MSVEDFTPLKIMLSIPPVFPIAIEIAFSIILIIDKTIVGGHAHPLHFSRPWAAMSDTILWQLSRCRL
ncbi:MAG TPA: hypothetical protein VE544_08250 [Nitrososphaeraceae archaeon]|jgi:hypothetical protein|nr:hypothetical protein [Nitrososphaeraceae archaeon]